MQHEEAIVIGAGPCGLAAAIELKEIGLNPLVIEKRNIVHSISQYPTYMQFFSSPELLEIGGIPFTTASDKPSRLEALNYYRVAAQRRDLRIRPYTAINAIRRETDGFLLTGEDRFGLSVVYYCRYVVIATGYFDHPNELGIPGEQSEKVSHFFRESHPYVGTEVAIIGGSNSAIDAALELERVGAKVTVVYRGESYSRSIKPWVRPGFESKVNKGAIRMLFSSSVTAIEQREIAINGPEGEYRIPNDFVLALTGFHPDRSFLTRSGVTMEDEGYPTFREDTMETNVPGIYLAGVVASRHEANEIFIESGRFHGRKIAEHIRSSR
ncbi:YpdA family putative bacillithiol disulfide reductase [Paenibacillus arenilitoris]|uniref:YpdA family putative bacillithiol disulfide reductase n=1 Tax=Paenibacillus arenilitoris TaxID=2772299 RepID=A0A927CNE6_9BACL|nr:YpdA family putative bacillithiol disulfide reductase [Paenibacillus arenilitoris]MBD2869768.1 YpdA family putative bacillithiol disulfide reductase [Paenibacillus arenilitoris]